MPEKMTDNPANTYGRNCLRASQPGGAVVRVDNNTVAGSNRPTLRYGPQMFGVSNRGRVMRLRAPK